MAWCPLQLPNLLISWLIVQISKFPQQHLYCFYFNLLRSRIFFVPFKGLFLSLPLNSFCFVSTQWCLKLNCRATQLFINNIFSRFFSLTIAAVFLAPPILVLLKTSYSNNTAMKAPFFNRVVCTYLYCHPFPFDLCRGNPLKLFSIYLSNPQS